MTSSTPVPLAPTVGGNDDDDDTTERRSNYFEALSETVDDSKSTQDSSSASLLTKTDRKKLKKLKKRSIQVLVDSERSGLLTRAEYEEYNHLVKLSRKDAQQHSGIYRHIDDSMKSNESSLPPACPSVHLRNKCSGMEKAEGATHRDLLSWLLQQKFDGGEQDSKSSRKRKRNGEKDEKKTKANPITLPHWASVHNPGSCEQVAVLEVHVPHDKIDPYSQLLKACNSKIDGKERGKNDADSSDQSLSNSQVGMATKWFQGYLPKSMSESLLYFSNVKKDEKKKKSDAEFSIPSKEGFVERLEAMLLSAEEMHEQGYPKALPSTPTETIDSDMTTRKEKFKSPDSIPEEKANGYVETFGVRIEDQNEEDKSAYIETPKSNSDDANEGDRPARVIGLDCEMVLTTLGSELARVTLLEFDEFVAPKINSKTTLLLDCVVRPKNRIVDYLTKHSGITPALMEPSTTTLEQVQYALASYLTPNDILIGHSLENDMRALHYIHPRVVDTSMIFRPEEKNKRFKFSLRHLSKTLLKKQIQTGSHCSEEDAQTTLDLALLKALKGDNLQVPGFGSDQKQTLLRQPFVQDGVAAFIGPNQWLEAHITKYPNGAHALAYDCLQDCKKAMLAWMNNRNKAHLIWSKVELGDQSSSSSASEASIETFKSLVVSYRGIFQGGLMYFKVAYSFFGILFSVDGSREKDAPYVRPFGCPPR